MSRYRPRETPGSKFITAQGERRLREELEYLWRSERPRVTQAVAEAAAMGDRSENAEYIYGKRHLREIDRRIRFLRKRLDGMTVVDRAPADRTRVYFGAWVELEAEDGGRNAYRLVGPDELDAARGYLSMDSPLGRALLGKRIDDEITLEVPGGQRTLVLVSIRYES